MSALKEHMGMLGQFLKTDFRKILLGCTLAMVVAILLGYVLGSFSPETIDTVLEQFAAMVEDAGIMDTEGNISPFGLLTNNWTAMLLAALYGFDLQRPSHRTSGRLVSQQRFIHGAVSGRYPAPRYF